jgi:hypothetical protein
MVVPYHVTGFACDCVSMPQIWETSAESASQRLFALNIVSHAYVELLRHIVFA